MICLEDSEIDEDSIKESLVFISEKEEDIGVLGKRVDIEFKKSFLARLNRDLGFQRSEHFRFTGGDIKQTPTT